MHYPRKARIIATIGPASSSPDRLKELFLAGADTFRLNFSHGTHEEHADVHAAIRALEKEVKCPLGILQDLQGPKVRIGMIKDGKITVNAGENVRFVPSENEGDHTRIPLPHPEIFEVTLPGHQLLIDDGRLRMRVRSVSKNHIEAQVIIGGVISSHKGVNTPESMLAIPILTEKDKADLAFGLKLGIDWVAISFVQRPEDVINARTLIGDAAGLIAKIEKPSALNFIDDIVALSDAVMVARGDLGVEIPPEEVPGRQKEIIHSCRMAGKPVIIATQMLDSMIHAPTPTRAEASDVASAIYDGADVVMLSAESASGRYPVEAVAMMDRIIRSTEAHKMYPSLVNATDYGIEETPAKAIAMAAANLADQINAAVIVAFTKSGATAARVARERPRLPILAITTSKEVHRRLCLLWGAHSVLGPEVRTYEDMVDWTKKIVISERFAEKGDIIVAVSGIPFGQSGSTNNLRVIQL